MLMAIAQPHFSLGFMFRGKIITHAIKVSMISMTPEYAKKVGRYCPPVSYFPILFAAPHHQARRQNTTYR